MKEPTPITHSFQNSRSNLRLSSILNTKKKKASGLTKIAIVPTNYTVLATVGCPNTFIFPIVTNTSFRKESIYGGPRTNYPYCSIRNYFFLFRYVVMCADTLENVRELSANECSLRVVRAPSLSQVSWTGRHLRPVCHHLQRSDRSTKRICDRLFASPVTVY